VGAAHVRLLVDTVVPHPGCLDGINSSATIAPIDLVMMALLAFKPQDELEAIAG
jgi:hypothetical protein